MQTEVGAQPKAPAQQAEQAKKEHERPERLRLKQIIQNALDSCKTREGAYKQVVKKVDDDQEIKDYLYERYIPQRLWLLVRARTHGLRRQVEFIPLAAQVDLEASRNGQEGRRDSKATESAVAAERYGRFYAYPLPIGIKLGDADREAIETCENIWFVNAQGNARRASFMKTIKRKLKGEAKVSQVYSEKQLEAIWERIAGKEQL